MPAALPAESVLVVALLWEFTAYLGIFPRKLFPPLEEVAATFVRLTANGILPHHVLDTLVRLITRRTEPHVKLH